MKTVLLIRHAKSSWEDSMVSDFERPLNTRGTKDAAEMAKRLVHRQIIPSLFISSPARRARITASFFLDAFKIQQKELVLIPALYHATVTQLYDTICSLGNDHPCVALFTHNPGITEFVNEQTDKKIDNMPTAAIFAVCTNIPDWAGYRDAPKNLLFFDYPKAGL